MRILFSYATHFDMNGRAPVLALIEKLKATRKWAIAIQVTRNNMTINNSRKTLKIIIYCIFRVSNINLLYIDT